MVEELLPLKWEVDVLPVHEEPRIEVAGLFKRLPAYEHERTGKYVGPAGSVFRQMPQVIGIEQRRAREYPPQAIEFEKGGERRGESSL